MSALGVEIRDLVREYRSSQKRLGRRGDATVRALRGVSFQIAPGELFGLLGPNGAGKTTLVRILATMLLPTAGSATVAGFDVAREPRRVRPLVGCVFGGDRGFYDRLSGYDNLRYFAELYAQPAARARERIGQLLELVGLAGREHERVETYSRGMRQRLHLARGLLHDPSVILLDEPTLGIDPVGARELRHLVGTLRSAGKTILLTTHYMFEADELCDRVAVIDAGEIVASGTPSQLKSLAGSTQVLEVELHGASLRALDAVRALDGVASVTVREIDQIQLLQIQVARDHEVSRAVLGALGEVPVGRIVTREPTLEDAYVHLIQRRRGPADTVGAAGGSGGADAG